MSVLERENNVQITPDMAKRMLASSKGNRSIRRGNVEAYKHAMGKGEWKHNGDAIRFLPDGSLFDGHHRLTAVVESGARITTDLVTIDEGSKVHVDTGAPRSSADHLVFEHGLRPQQAGEISAAARYIIVHDEGLSQWIRPSGGKLKRLLATHQIEEWFIENRREIGYSQGWREQNIPKQHLLIPRSGITAIHFMASRCYKLEDVEDVLRQMLTGYGVEPETTQDHIRRSLLAAAMQQRKMPTKHRVASVAKGVKTVLSGRQIKHRHNALFRASSDKVPFFT